MRFHRTSHLVACLSVLFLACGGGGGGSGDTGQSTFKVFGSARSTGAAAALATMATAGSPTSLEQVFYKGWVSTSADCSNPVLLDDLGSTGKVIEFYDNPVIFEGSPPDGTYRCIIVEISDTMRFVPDAAAQDAFPGICVSGTAYDMDTFRTGDDERVVLGSSDPQQGEGTAAAAVPQAVDVFISTDPAAVAAPPSQVVQLLAPLEVPGQSTFYADFAGLVGDSDGHCWLEKGEVGFR